MFSFRRTGTILLVMAAVWTVLCLMRGGDPLTALNLVTLVLGGSGGTMLVLAAFLEGKV